MDYEEANLPTIKDTTRKIELVDELIEKAKLSKNELMPLVQNIYIGPSITSEEYKVLELDEDKFNYLMNGNSLIVRGNESEDAVCCTKDSTFSLKIAEISNPLLLSSSLKFPLDVDQSEERSLNKVQISYITNTYFVLEKEKPKLQKLRNLLETNFYCGKTIDDNSNAAKYTLEDLLNTIQSSEEELYVYLNFIEAYQIDGYWRLLDYKYYSEIIDNVLKLIDEKSWQSNNIPVIEIQSELKTLYSLSVINQVISYYFVPQEDDSSLYEIKKEKIAHFYAEALLRSTLKMRYAEFVLILKKSIPSCFNYEYNISQIQDLCYVEDPYIYYLNVLDLPDNIEKRFKFLFDKRKKWSQDELRAFIRDLCSNDNTEINNSLTKYCRPFVQNNIKYYTSRI